MSRNYKPDDHWISTAKGLSGYFAVEYWVNPDMGGFVEPYDIGLGRYATELEAQIEAWSWANEIGMPFDLPGFNPPSEVP